MSAILPPMPTQAPLVEEDLQQHMTPYLSRDWYLWFFEQQSRVQSAVQIVGGVTVKTGQAASITATPLSLSAVNVPSVQGGYYRINWYGRVTQAATVSSSLSVTIAWTESGVTLTSTSAAVTGNATTTVIQGALPILIDAPGPVTFATTYASSGATPMQYRISVWPELIV